MFRKVTTQRPLRAVLRLSENNMRAVLNCKPMAKLSDANKTVLSNFIVDLIKENGKDVIPYEVVDSVAKKARAEMDKPEVTGAVIAKALRDNCLERDADYPVVYDKHGAIMADPNLKDTENIPFDTSFEAYMEREVLPYAPETWIDESVRDKGPLADGRVGVVGTNINFNKFFYHYEEPRKPEEIAKEIMELESGLEGFMKEFL